MKFAICDNIVRLKGIMISQISQTEKDKYSMIPLICRILKQTNKKTKTQTHTHRKQQTHRENRPVEKWVKGVKR